MANISNYTNYYVYGTDDNDNIDNFRNLADVYAFGGNDLIRNFYAKYSLVQGYSGKDSIYNFGEESTVDGGDDADYIGNSASNAIILGGGGRRHGSFGQGSGFCECRWRRR